jgi:hypothetical protein
LDVQNDWALLIYSLPSQPSRKRAYVWRELKKLGAIYLRDGVAVLPRRPNIEAHLQGMVCRILEYEGTADLILSPRFAPEREQQIVVQFQEERVSEYREIYHACVRFLRDVLHDVDADDFGFPDVGNLESELARLHRWHEQIVERDYFQSPGGDRVSEILVKCDRAFEHFASQASERADGSDGQSADDVDDVFERLGGGAGAAQALPDDYPL